MIKNRFKLLILLFVLLVITACSNIKQIDAYRKEGINSLKNENYEEALDFFNMALNAGVGEVGNIQYDILLYKAECLFSLNRYAEYKKIYDILLKFKGNNKKYAEIYEIVNNFALLESLKDSLNNNKIDEAEKTIEEFKSVGLEHDRSVLFNEAVIYEKKGEWKYALDQFKYYLTQFPNDEKALYEVDFITTILGVN